MTGPLGDALHAEWTKARPGAAPGRWRRRSVVLATTGLSGLPISPWAGLGVVAAWAAAALLAGRLLLRLRDA
jgi:hypothetical protein